METVMSMDLERGWGPIFDPGSDAPMALADYDYAAVTRFGDAEGGLTLHITGFVPVDADKVFVMPDVSEEMPDYRLFTLKASPSKAPPRNVQVRRFDIRVPLRRLSGRLGIELRSKQGTQRFGTLPAPERQAG